MLAEVAIFSILCFGDPVYRTDSALNVQADEGLMLWEDRATGDLISTDRECVAGKREFEPHQEPPYRYTVDCYARGIGRAISAVTNEVRQVEGLWEFINYESDGLILTTLDCFVIEHK